MRKLKVLGMVKIAVVAALYAVLTIVLGDLSFGPIQCRVSEILLMLVLIDPKYIYGLTLGTIIANCFSPLGWIDILFGTGASVIAMLLMIFIKPKWLSFVWAPVINGLLIGVELMWVYELPYALTAFQVFVGELIVIIIGMSIYYALRSNKKFMQFMKLGTPSKKQLAVEECENASLDANQENNENNKDE